MRTVQNLSIPLGVKYFKPLRRIKEFVFDLDVLGCLKFKVCLKKFLRQFLRQLNPKIFKKL